VAVECTKLALMARLMSSAAAAQVRSRLTVEIRVFMFGLLTGRVAGSGFQAWSAVAVGAEAVAVAVDCTKAAPMTMLMSKAAAAQVRSRYRLETMAFMSVSSWRCGGVIPGLLGTRSVVPLIGVVLYYNTTLVSRHLTGLSSILLVRFLATALGYPQGDLRWAWKGSGAV